MPEYQRQTVEAKRVRFWGGITAIGGLAIAAAAYIGLASVSNAKYSSCDAPKPTEACKTVQQEEADWLKLLEYGGSIALAGGMAYGGANTLDRKILLSRYARHIERESQQPGTSTVAEYMERMPVAPPEGEYPEGN